MKKHINLVDLVKSIPTNILLQNLASIQKRPSPIKFAHLSEKSANGSISNLSTKATTRLGAAHATPGGRPFTSHGGAGGGASAEIPRKCVGIPLDRSGGEAQVP